MRQAESPSEAHYEEALTQLLHAAATGEAAAAAALLPMVYEQLRRLAANKMREQAPQHTLQATALVHEAYVRLVQGDGARQWEGQRHFFAAAAEAMRCILVDHARRKGRLKRGGGDGAARQRVDLEQLSVTIDNPPEDLLALDEALTALARSYPERAQLVKLRHFAGLTIDEAARTLDI